MTVAELDSRALKAAIIALLSSDGWTFGEVDLQPGSVHSKQAARVIRAYLSALATSVAEPTILLSSNDPSTGAPVHAPEAFLRTPSPHKGEPVAWTNQDALDVMALKGADTPYEQPMWSEASPEHSIALFASPPPVAEGMVPELRQLLLAGTVSRRGSSNHGSTIEINFGPEEKAESQGLFDVLCSVAAAPNQADGAGE